MPVPMNTATLVLAVPTTSRLKLPPSLRSPRAQMIGSVAMRMSMLSTMPRGVLEFAPNLADFEATGELMIRMSLEAGRPVNWNVLIVNAAHPEEYRGQTTRVTSHETGRAAEKPLDEVLRARFAEITAMELIAKRLGELKISTSTLVVLAIGPSACCARFSV